MPDQIKDLYNSLKSTKLFLDETDFRDQLNKNPKEVFGIISKQKGTSGLFLDYEDFSNVTGLKKKVPEPVLPNGGTPSISEVPLPSGITKAKIQPVEYKEPGVGEDEKLARQIARAQKQAISTTAAKPIEVPPAGLPKAPQKKEEQGWLSNMVSALDKGFYKNLIGSPAKALGTLVQYGTSAMTGGRVKEGPVSDALIKFGDYFNNAIDEIAPQDPEFRNSLSDQFGQALGQVGSMVFTGGIGAGGKGAAIAEQAIPKAVVGKGIAGKIAPAIATTKAAGKELVSELASPAAISAGLVMGQSEFDRAKQAGATDDQAFEAFYKNAAVGSILEKIPVMQFFKRFNQSTGGGVVNYIKTKGVAGITGGLEEATTEVLQQIYANKTAKDIYNTNQDIFEGITESGVIGFGVGFLLNAMGANAKLLRKQGKEAEAQIVDAQIKEFESRAEKGPEVPPAPEEVAPEMAQYTMEAPRLAGEPEQISKPIEPSVEPAPKKEISEKSEQKLKEIWNNIGNNRGRSALEDGWAESFGHIQEALSVGGQNYQAHGMGKSGFPAALRDLFDLFKKGIDPSRGGGQLYTAPLVISQENKAAASAIGTAGGTAYTDGAFVLVTRKGVNGIRSIDDIGGILVNNGLTDISPEILTELRKAFPNLVIESYQNTKKLVEQLNQKAEQSSVEAAPQAPTTEEKTYRVEYFDPETRKMTHQMFATEAEGEAFKKTLTREQTSQGVRSYFEKAPTKGVGEVAPEAAPQVPAAPEKVEPIRQLGTGANVYFENENYRVNDFRDKVLLNVSKAGDAGIVVNLEFNTPEEAVDVAKTLNRLYPQGVPEAVLLDKVVEDIKAGKYKEVVGEVAAEAAPEVPAAPIEEEELPFGETAPRETVETKEEKNLTKRALNLEVSTPRAEVLQYFISGGKISPEALTEFFGKERRMGMGKIRVEERRSRTSLTNKNAPSIEALAEKIAGTDRLDQVQEYREAIEEALLNHSGTKTMAEELVRDYDFEFAEIKRAAELEELGEEVEAEVRDFVSQIPTAQQEEIIKVLDKFRDNDGFIDWAKIDEEIKFGFEPVLFELSESSQKIINDAIKQFQETGRVGRISPEVISEKEVKEVKPKTYAIQEPTAGEVPVQPEAGVSEEVEGGVPPPKPPKVTKEGEAEGEDEKELRKLAANVPDTGKVAEYLSKGTIEKYTGETPTSPQERGVQELQIALEHGEKIINKAKELFGKDYVEKTLDFIEKSQVNTSNKALMYVSLENALAKEKLDFPDRANEITKQQALVYKESQAFARESSLALNYQKLRKVAQVGYDSSKITDNLFTSEELEGKQLLQEAIEATPDQVNKAAEEGEVEAEEKVYTEKDLEKKVEEGVRSEVEKLFEQLPKESKSRAEKALKVLGDLKKKLRSRTYDATLGIPVAIIDAGITTIENAIKLGISIEKAIDLGIKKIKEKLKGKDWAKEDDFRKDMLEEFKAQKIDTKASSSPMTIKQSVKEALIKKGFGREVTIKGEKKTILDWKKLAGKAGTVEKIQENVESAMKDQGYSEKEISEMRDEYVQEYIDLRQSIIQKAQNELARRNNAKVSPKQKSAAKRLAELYTFGLFEEKKSEFDNVLNSALGTDISEKAFNEANKIAEAMESIYSATFNGVRLSDVSAKSALEKLEDRLRILLYEESKRRGNFALRATNLVRSFFDVSQTMILNSIKNTIENPLSGLQQKLIDKLFLTIGKERTRELVAERRKLMKDIYKDMVINGGIGYGKSESQFVNRRHLDDYVNKLSDNKLYHGIASVVTGKAALNAMDAMFKAGLTEARFTSNLVRILTSSSNPQKMSKSEAIKFVSEKITGQTLEQARTTAQDIINKINQDAGEELIKSNPEQINRFANDIVKAALEMNGVITSEQIMAAYNSAYKSAGLSVGHESNNIVSSMVRSYSATVEGQINNAIKEKEWNNAALLTLKSILFRNILNPFVGGGTNWLVLKLEKTGLGLFTGLAYEFSGRKDIDVTSKTGLAKLEKRLFNQSRAKDSYMRGLVGGLASMIAYGAFVGLADEDEYRKWRARNQWAAKYLDLITPEYLLAQMAVENKAIKKYAATSFNKNDAFDATNKLIKSVEYAVKGDSSKAWGSLGEAVGSKLNTPLPWRLVRDGQILYQGIKGEDPYHGNFKQSEGFWSGALQGGAIEWLGFRPVGKGKFDVALFKIEDSITGEEREVTEAERVKVKDEANKIYNELLNEYKKDLNNIWLDVSGKIRITTKNSKDAEVETWEEKKYNKLNKEQQEQLSDKIWEKALNSAKKILE